MADVKTLLNLVLDMQKKHATLVIDMDARIAALEVALAALDSRAAGIFAAQLEIERNSRRTALEEMNAVFSLDQVNLSKVD